MRHVGNATISPHLCGKDVLSSVILDCKQIIIFGYLGLQANNYLCLSRIAKLRTDFSILSSWCTLHECLRRRRCTAIILHDRVFSSLSFLEFSLFPLCRGAHINSGAGGAKWCRERSTACFLIFTLFLNFCSFRPFLHTCPAMPCHLRLSSNLLFLHSIIATSRWHKKISKRWKGNLVDPQYSTYGED